eukprot:g8336.t1
MPRAFIRDPLFELPDEEHLRDPSLPRPPPKRHFKEQPSFLVNFAVREGEAEPVVGCDPALHRQAEEVVQDLLERLAKVTSFVEVRQILDVASDELPAVWRNTGVSKRKGPQKFCPDVESLKKSYRRYRTDMEYKARATDPGPPERPHDRQIEPDMSDWTVNIKKPEPFFLREFARAQLVARYNVPANFLEGKKIKKQGDIVLEDPELPDAAESDAVERKRIGRVKEYLPTLINESILASLHTAAAKRQYLSYSVGVSVGTVTQKVRAMQLTLGVDINEVVGHKSRLKGVSKLGAGAARIGDPNDADVDTSDEDEMDMDAKRRRLFEGEDKSHLNKVCTGAVYELQGNLSTGDATRKRKRETAEADKLQGALRRWVERAEIRKCDITEWWKFLNMLKFAGGIYKNYFFIFFVFRAQTKSKLERGLRNCVDPRRKRSVEELPPALEDLDGLNVGAVGNQMLGSGLAVGNQMFGSGLGLPGDPMLLDVVFDHVQGPGTAVASSKQKALNIEVFVCRTMTPTGKVQLKPLFPKPLVHKGGFRNVLQDLYVMLRRGVNWHRAKFGGAGDRFLQCFMLQYVCLMHQYHLLEGDLITGDVTKEFLQDLKAVISASSQWLEKVPTLHQYQSHRWMTLSAALRDVVDNRIGIENGLQALSLDDRKPEMRATAKRAKKALCNYKDRFWTNVHAVQAAFEPVQHADAKLLKHSRTVFSDASISAVVNDAPAAREDFASLFEEHLLLRPQDMDGLRMLVNLRVIMPRREAQLLTFPWLLNHFHHPVLSQRAAAAFQQHPTNNDDFLLFLQTAYADDIDDLAHKRLRTVGENLGKVLEAVPTSSVPAAVFPESSHSAMTYNKKIAPSIQMERLSVRTAMAREDEMISWEHFPAIEAAWEETHDKRKGGGERMQHVRVLPQMEEEPKKQPGGELFLRETLDACCDAMDLYSQEFANTPHFTVEEPLHESGRFEISPGVLKSVSWDAEEILVLNRAQKTMLATEMETGDLVVKKMASAKKQEAEQVYYYFRQKCDAGYLLPVKIMHGAKKSPGQELVEYTLLFNSVRSLRNWIAYPKNTTTKNDFEYHTTTPLRAYWNAQKEAVVFVALAKLQSWVKGRHAFKDIFQGRARTRTGEVTTRDYVPRTGRRDREVKWSTLGAYDHSVAIPEKKYSEVLADLRVIFRPETGTWFVNVPLDRRRKKRGEGFTADQWKPETSQTPHGILAPDAVKEHRRIALGLACDRLGIELPEVTQEEEERAWGELDRYIQDTAGFDFSSSEESGASSEG